jgi:hypothetical protein
MVIIDGSNDHQPLSSRVKIDKSGTKQPKCSKQNFGRPMVGLQSLWKVLWKHFSLLTSWSGSPCCSPHDDHTQLSFGFVQTMLQKFGTILLHQRFIHASFPSQLFLGLSLSPSSLLLRMTIISVFPLCQGICRIMFTRQSSLQNGDYVKLLRFIEIDNFVVPKNKRPLILSFIFNHTFHSATISSCRKILCRPFTSVG